MYKIIFFISTALFWQGAFAQSLQLQLPAHAADTVQVIAINGMATDTLGQVVLDAAGAGVFVYKAQGVLNGLVLLHINPAADFEMILSPAENPVLYCTEEKFTAQNTQVKNSAENSSLQRWFARALPLLKKQQLNKENIKLYQPAEIMYKQLQAEKLTIDKNIVAFNDSLKASPLFAARYIQFVLANPILQGSNQNWGSAQRSRARNYFQQEINFESLYRSGQWFNILNICQDAYTKAGAYYGKFGADVVANLKKIKDNKVYKDFASAMLSVTEKYSWEADQDSIVSFLYKDHRIEDPTGKLKKFYDAVKLKPGKTAPDVIVTNHTEDVAGHSDETSTLKAGALSPRYSLLVFYQSGCNSCEATMQTLQNNYSSLNAKGYRLITFSADLDKNTFENAARNYPWQDKYCDLKGFNGTNFTNFAVSGTPTVYVLNNKGIIQAKLASGDELMDWVKTNNEKINN